MGKERGLTKHIKRYAQRNIEEIFVGVFVGLRIDGTAEHGDDLVRKDQINSCQNQTAHDDHDNGVAHAFFCCGPVVSAEADADKGAAAVTHHNGNRQSYHGQWENNGIGCVSVGTEITGVGNKNLVDDVVKKVLHLVRNR